MTDATPSKKSVRVRSPLPNLFGVRLDAVEREALRLEKYLDDDRFRDNRRSIESNYGSRLRRVHMVLENVLSKLSS